MNKSFLSYLTVLILSLFIKLSVNAQVNISGIVNQYTAVTGISQPACAPCDVACIHTITVTDGSLFQPGDKALIIQMKGATINTANATGSGNVTAINNAGNYEFFEVGSVVGNVLTPAYPLIRNYTVTDKVQVVRIPQFADNVNITGTLTAQDWDEVAGTGGVVAIEAKKVTFNAGINVLGQGYKGIQMLVNGTPDDCSPVPTALFNVSSGINSTYTKGDGIVIDDVASNRGRAPRANGGGAGISGDSGGGGGSNFGAGGEGGKRWCDIDGANAGGVGGFSLSTFLAQNKVFLGGAGGPGFVTTNNPSNAADGGGIVIIFADTIVGNGNTINARGTSPVAINPVGAPDGGGGGGAGGSVVLKTETYIGTLTVDVSGGDGQDLNTTTPHGPGGGGGGGVLLYSLASLPAGLTLTNTGGIGGQHLAGASSVRNGSQDGNIGGSISLYVPIQNPNYQGNVDNDVIPVSCDIDDDNDGVPDVVEAYNGDHDTDGIMDYMDPDFCGATFQGVNGWDCATMGLPDPSGDMDGDLIPNYMDANFPTCGGLISGGICASFDADGDGNPVHLDLDSDNDGIPDLIEAGGVDTNGDGQVDSAADTDGDGLANLYDNNDTDGPTGSAPCTPSPNCLLTTSTSLLLDTDANGTNDFGADFDNDGLPNFVDLDSDNDGITDVIEANGLDANNDGIADAFVDIDNDGYNDVVDGVFENCTTTGSYIYSPSSIAYATSNGPGDVSVTNPVNALGEPLAADFALLNSTGDIATLQIANTVNAGGTIRLYISNPSGNTANTNLSFSSNGTTFTNVTASNIPAANTAMTVYAIVVPINTVAIRVTRTDNDDINLHGLDYTVPASVLNTLNTTCVTNNGTPLITTGADSDADGNPNSYVSGNNDSDLQCNFIDIDSDNDGIVDNSEAQATTTYIAPSGSDSDNDGIDNAYDANNGGTAIIPVNTDGVDNVDYLDLNSDNDALSDAIEGWDTDGNGVANTLPTGLDSDNDGLDDAYDVNDALVNPTNGTTPSSYPNVIISGTPERDWRELNPPTVTLTGTTTIAENAAGVATLTATLSVATTTATTITIGYTGTATNGTDYTPSSVTITIPAGATTGTVTIDPTDDVIFEGSETVIADITNVTGGNGATESGTQTATVTITDNEVAPTVTLTGTTTIAENAAGVATLTATLSVATTTATTITIGYTGTATNGTDYAPSSVTITIPAGSTTGIVTIDPTDDALFEGSETVIADITNVTGGNGATESGTQTATVTITDNEVAPTVTLTGTTTIAENAAGVATLTATLSVATTTATTITIGYTGTATNGTDYAPSSVTITIPAGSTTGTVTIDPTDDVIFEGSETVIADITNVTGGNGATESGTQTATVTITDNEVAPTVTLTGTTSIAENAAGVATLTATLSVATTTATTITIGYTGTATNGTDYAPSSVTITIPAGSTTGTVTIDPTDDALFEGSETVIADITNVTGGNGATESGTQTATVTITDNEVAPTVTLTGTTTIAENAAGVATLTATLSVATTTATTITIGYTGTATNGTDYTPSSVTITISAGSTTGTVTIDPTDDALFEGSETVIADITSVTGGNGATESGTQTATVTITDNEVAPTVTLTGTTTIAENAAGVATLTATLSVATTTATTITIGYTGTATNGTDYTPSSVTITIPAGSTTGTVTIDPTDDALFEGSETVIADITNVTGGNGATESGTQTATVTITDNEVAPTVTLTGTTSIAENAAGVATLTATLSVATTTATTITIGYTGTATNGTDYAPSSVTITIPAGSTTGTVTIDPTDDVTSETSETVIADITNVTGGNGATESGTQTAIVTITDDDTPTVSLSGTTTVAEDGLANATLTLTLSVASTQNVDVTLGYTGTATNGTDYATGTITVTIPAGSTSVTFDIDPTSDLISEGNETVVIDITNVTGGNGTTENGTQTATVTIIDNDAPTVTLTGTTTIAENAAGVATLTATLSNVATTATTITIGYTGTATNGTDYTPSSVTITIPAGSTTGTVTIDPIDDISIEGNETVIADITNVTGGNGATESGTQTATVTILEDDAAPTANDDIVATPLTEDGANGIVSILINDTDPNGNPSAPTNGGGQFVIDMDPVTAGVQTSIITTDGTWTYNPVTGDVTFDPATNFNGTATVTYQLCDPSNACDNAIISFVVSPVNDAPIVDDENITTPEETPVSGDVTDAGDSDPDGTPLTVNTTPVDGPNNGTIVVNTNGTYTYTPNVNFNGTDTVVVSVCDAGTPLPAICVNDTIFITVTPINDAPTVDNENITTPEETPVSGDVTDAGDSDPDGTPLTVNTTPVDGPNNGTIVVNTNGTYTYTPNTNFTGTDTVVVSVCDAGTPLPAICVNDTIFITVTPINDAPIVDNENITTPEETPVSGDVTDAGDSDPDGTPLTVNTTPVDGPNNGTIVVNTNGTYTYTPNVNFNGTDTVVVSVCDAGTPLPAICVNDTIFITITPINDAPIVDNEFHTTNINTPVNGDLTNAGDSDPDGTPLTVNTTPVDGPNNGTIVVNTDGTYTYTPTVNFNGTDTVVVSVCDTGLPLPAICVNDTIFITVLACPSPFDTDSDGLTDCEETTGINDPGTPATPSGTSNPNDPCSPIGLITTDTDGDGLTDCEETTGINDPGTPTTPTGTSNPNDPCSPIGLITTDTDGDGLTDCEETTGVNDPGTPATPTGTSNPTDPCSPIGLITTDTDNDGLTDCEETTGVNDPGTPATPTGTSNPTDPCSPIGLITTDTDGDGLTDCEETTGINDPGTPATPAGTTDPADACDPIGLITVDTDNDGLTDCEETTGVNDPGTPATPTGTSNPNDPCSPIGLITTDTDNDGLTDCEETTGVNDPGTPATPTGTSNPNDPCSPIGLITTDTDNDGLTDCEETTGVDDPSTPTTPTGTSNPNDPCSPIGLITTDTDGDGLTDCEETTGIDDPGTPIVPTGTSDPTDPCDPNPTVDTDGDGLTNCEEGSGVDDPGTPAVPTGTSNPNDPCSPIGLITTDTDNDGLTDCEETTGVNDPGTPGTPTGTSNPNDPCSPIGLITTDTDGDGLTDCEETTGVNDPGTPATPTGTSNPTDPCSPIGLITTDTDGDGLTDCEETTGVNDPGTPATPNGTSNPNDPCSPIGLITTDTDGDGLTDCEETTGVNDPGTPVTPTGTSNPNDPCDPIGIDDTDTDGDGLTDCEEETGVDDPSTPAVPTGTSDPKDPCSPRPCLIDIPEAFTPDGDGTNDAFVITGIELFPNNTITIFNRWGNQVFFTEKYDNTWEGKSTSEFNIGGDELPTGTYFYIFDTRTTEYGVVKGYVYLKR
ncbi:Ig-like domain-containing protein [Fluviicola taffensis]|uniref:Calx-beta domain-containing protein n=1 Tax=Fluviicola taffensis TaxID=191579 RepID=UPI003137C46E